MAHDADVRDPLAYLYRIAFRVAAADLVRRKQEGTDMPEIAIADPSANGLPDLLHALRELTPAQRAAVYLHYRVDLPVREVARVTGMSSAAVKVHLMRGRRRLRELLGEEDDAMTERWRKKLGDLDATGPGDDVFAPRPRGPAAARPADRAPQDEHEDRDRRRRVRRVRARDQRVRDPRPPHARTAARRPPVPCSFRSGRLARSTTWSRCSSAPSAGDADAVWALDPRQVAERFGREVLGWDAMAIVDMTGIVTDCTGNDSCPITAVEGPSGYPVYDHDRVPGCPVDVGAGASCDLARALVRRLV